MAHHNDHGHSTEQKPVSFMIPMLLGLIVVAVLIFLATLSDSSHSNCDCSDPAACSTECMKACESGHHEGHEAKASDTPGENHEAAPATESAAADSTGSEESKVETQH